MPPCPEIAAMPAVNPRAGEVVPPMVDDRGDGDFRGWILGDDDRSMGVETEPGFAELIDSNI